MKFTRILLLLAAVQAANGCAPKSQLEEEAARADTLAATPPADTTVPVALVDLKTAEILRLNAVWTGDYDSLGGDRRFIRALVPLSRTMYYLDRGVQKGIAFESLREFEKQLPPLRGGVPAKVVIIPTRRDRMTAALQQGHADIAVGAFTVSGSRPSDVEFSIPTMTGVREVVVTRSRAPFATEDDLAGLEIHVRRSSSYYQDLTALNGRLAARGKPPVKIQDADETLEDEDLLQLVDAGLIPATVTKQVIATFWQQMYDSLTVHEAVPTRTDAELAWAIRKGTPVLTRLVNDFVTTHRAGTTFGNIVFRKYLGSTARLNNAAAQAERQKLQQLAGHFRSYGERYDLPWLLIAAQSYQESQFDQSRRSHVGAVGVMQVKPETAADRAIGITGIEAVEPNIHAGVKYLRWVMDRYFADSTIDQLNKGLFALAAYNAGPGRVRQLRRKAEAAGLDPNIWFGNVELIAAREIGRETVDYVSNIYKYYTVYRSIQAVRGDSVSTTR